MTTDIDVSRPTTPESLGTKSYHHVNSTIDDLTLALASFSRVPSPDPPSSIACCCGRDDCQCTQTWQELKGRLESRLILSAEVGQALLQRHEAYVRQHEVQRRPRPPTEPDEKQSDEGWASNASASEISNLVKEKALLEKRLHQALINNEVSEVSTKTVMNELHEARATISRLTAQNARSLGWEARLSEATREKDDMQQERDGQCDRARLAESRLEAMKDTAAKLQREARSLREALEARRLHRLESSETILQDARLRLEALHSSLGQTALVEHTELTNVLESLVADNETLKRDNAELQNMLVESREEMHTLQEEVEEYRLQPPSGHRVETPRIPKFSSSAGKDHSLQYKSRSLSADRRSRKPFEPLTPETSRRPLSPADSLACSEGNWSSRGQIQSQPHYISSHVSIEVETPEDYDEPSSPEKPKAHKTLLLLTRSRGVQTETWPGLLSPLALPSHHLSSSPHDRRSETSSFSDTLSSHLSVLLDRISSLHDRMSQADALTLTNRLKRQRLTGADVGHLSRTTVNGIMTESNNLRGQFRFLLEDDTLVIPCTRKDFRVLFKIIKDMFMNMGEMRVVLNDIILDPSCATKVSEHALNPRKVEQEEEKEREALSHLASGWMAPISKLFSQNGSRGEMSEERHAPSRLVRSVSGRGTTRPMRHIPKLGPALSASTTTVNVEFSGTAVGRSTTSTVASHAKQINGEIPGPPSTSQTTSTVMNIFAGAPQRERDPWIVVPKGPRKMHSFMDSRELNTSTIGRSVGRKSLNRMSRDVDAVIDIEGLMEGEDDETVDYVAPLLQRTLRRRGLSDSSIHSTFASQADDTGPQPSTSVLDFSVWPDRHSVFQSLTRTMQTFRNTATVTAEGRQSSQPPEPLSRPPKAASVRNLLPDLSSWTVGYDAPESLLVGSLREETFIRPPIRESRGQDRY